MLLRIQVLRDVTLCYWMFPDVLQEHGGYMGSRYIGLLFNMGWTIRGGGGQGMVISGGPAQGHT